MKRLAPWALLALAVALPVALACAPKRKAPEVQEVVLWAPWPDEVLQPVIVGFTAEHPGLRVRVETMPESTQARRILAASPDQVPDLCAIATEDLPRLLAGGRLVDWSAGVADLKPQLSGWDACTVGDATYGIPWRITPRVLCYAPGLLARAGVRKPPATWSELKRAAARVQRLGHGVHGFGIPTGTDGLEGGLFPLAASAGSSVIAAGDRAAVLDSGRVADALALMVQLRRSALVAPLDSLEREFAAGRLGMMLARPGPRPDVGDSAVRVPHPDAGTSAGTWAVGLVLVSFNASKHRHEALDLARHLAGPAGQRDLEVELRRVGAEGGFASSAVVESTTNATQVPRATDPVSRFGPCRYAPAHPAWNAIKDTLATEVDAALRGVKTPARAAADARDHLKEIRGR